MSEGRILFVPTNGSGLGHLTRLLGLARRIKKLNEELEIIFLSTSPAMHLIMREGFLGYYQPARSSFSQDFTVKSWNELLNKLLSTILQLHKPNILVFDGATPYDGIVSTFHEHESMQTIWIRREQNKKRPNGQTRNEGSLFDKIIVPGEAGVEFRKESEHVSYCEPVIYLDKSELLPRETVRKEWRLHPNDKLVYIQLGAGNINDIHSVIATIISVVEKRQDVRIVLGESMIGKRLFFDNDKVMILRDYPNSLYFNAFDLAISAAGYNTFHELMHFSVPTIFIPNENTSRDDQVERATRAEKSGSGICLINPGSEELAHALKKGLDSKINQEMRESAARLVPKNGADEMAQLLLTYITKDA
ncbi:glycosyltransferase [Paenibacillus jiagnxiensis]|uniref:glycosyltransferase n=1 Tax=Paenibacillus jiagnxiensis TaxID=3228926 RepID=UPI0033A2F01D